MGIADSAASSAVALGTAKWMESRGIGASKKTILHLLNSTPEEVEKALDILASQDRWSNKETQPAINNNPIIRYQIGQWGLSISGSQLLIVAIIPSENATDITLESRSMMGQLMDWGRNQKNLDRAASFLQNTFSSQESKSSVLSMPATPLPKQSLIEQKSFRIFLIIMGFITIVLPLIFRVATVQKVNVQMQQLNLDSQRQCDLAKIQYALENYYERNKMYPEDIYNISFPEIITLPIDPQTSEHYQYRLTNPDRYELIAQLSSGRTVTKDPFLDFPGKNASIKAGRSTPPLLIDKSMYEIPCSLTEKSK